MSVLDYCDREGGHVALLKINLEKAFDCVRHAVLNVFEHVGVNDAIFLDAKMASINCSTKRTINRQLFNSIPVISSVRQGRPLSPLLFSLYLEPL